MLRGRRDARGDGEHGRVLAADQQHPGRAFRSLPGHAAVKRMPGATGLEGCRGWPPSCNMACCSAVSSRTVNSGNCVSWPAIGRAWSKSASLRQPPAEGAGRHQYQVVFRGDGHARRLSPGHNPSLGQRRSESRVLAGMAKVVCARSRANWHTPWWASSATIIASCSHILDRWTFWTNRSSRPKAHRGAVGPDAALSTRRDPARHSARRRSPVGHRDRGGDQHRHEPLSFGPPYHGLGQKV